MPAPQLVGDLNGGRKQPAYRPETTYVLPEGTLDKMRLKFACEAFQKAQLER